MLIWINGAHGAGKTRVARRLAATHPSTHLIDPERIGFMLRDLWPYELPGDFKLLRVWRELTLSVLRAAALERPERTLVVPMTIADSAMLSEILDGLRAARIDVRHFTLRASPRTLRRRIARRLDWPASRRWALAQIEPCAKALSKPDFAVHIDTEARTIETIAAEILARLSGDPNGSAPSRH
jgi:broad-specificity NMP kinase